jgi:hypothetical protein
MRRNIFKRLLIGLLFVSLISCASFVKNSYVTLNESKDLYYTVMGITADFQAKGIIDQVKRDQINKAAKIYKEAHNFAVDLLAIYKKTASEEDKYKLMGALSATASEWVQVAKLINAIKPGTIQATLIK